MARCRKPRYSLMDEDRDEDEPLWDVMILDEGAALHARSLAPGHARNMVFVFSRSDCQPVKSSQLSACSGRFYANRRRVEAITLFSL